MKHEVEEKITYTYQPSPKQLALELELARVQEAIRYNTEYGVPMTTKLMQELWLEEGRIKNELGYTSRKRTIMAKKDTPKVETKKEEKIVTTALVDLHQTRRFLIFDFKSRVKSNFRIQNDSSFLEGKTTLQIDRGAKRKAETGSRWETVGVINESNGRTYLNLFARHRDDKFLSELSAQWNIGKISLEKLPMPEPVTSK